MPHYRVLQKSFIGTKLVEEGEIVEYDGEPSDNLELVQAEKPAGKRKPSAADEADPA